MRKSSLLLIALFVALIVSTGCREERKIDVAAKLNPKTMATMTTKNVATFISDSGVVQYKIVAPIWKVYDEVDTPYWSFPQGLYLQKYDRSFQVIATVAADSARFFSQEKVWRLDGHVEMTKVPKDLFQTEQLYWDQRRRILYSDSFIHIETSTHTLEGIGFESDERLTSYRIIKPQGIFPVNSQDFAAGGTSSTAPSPVASPVTAAPGAPPQSSPIIPNNSTP